MIDYSDLGVPEESLLAVGHASHKLPFCLKPLSMGAAPHIPIVSEENQLVDYNIRSVRLGGVLCILVSSWRSCRGCAAV